MTVTGGAEIGTPFQESAGADYMYDSVVGGSGLSAEENIVEVTGSTIHGRILGGAAIAGKATGNKVAISGGKVDSVAGSGSVMGGLSETSDVTDNQVTIEDGGDISHSAIGGYILSGTALGNTVTIDSNTAHGVYGGLTESGRADGNAVTITNILMEHEFGKNVTDVGNGTAAVYGGRTEHGGAAGNTVRLENAVVYGSEEGDSVIGGYAKGGAAEQNTVELAGHVGPRTRFSAAMSTRAER